MAGVACHKGDGRPELGETFVLLEGQPCEVTLMGVSLAGEIQSENVLIRLMYYIPDRGDPKRMKVGISQLPACLYTEDKHQRQNKADIMKAGSMSWFIP